MISVACGYSMTTKEKAFIRYDRPLFGCSSTMVPIMIFLLKSGIFMAICLAMDCLAPSTERKVGVLMPRGINFSFSLTQGKLRACPYSRSDRRMVVWQNNIVSHEKNTMVSRIFLMNGAIFVEGPTVDRLDD